MEDDGTENMNQALPIFEDEHEAFGARFVDVYNYFIKILMYPLQSKFSVCVCTCKRSLLSCS